NTDGDVRDDKEDVDAGLNPLAPDFKVTVQYVSLTLTKDGDSGSNAGDIGFNFNVRLPSDTGDTGLSGSPTAVVNYTALLANLPIAKDRDGFDEMFVQNNHFGIPMSDGQTLLLSDWLSDDERSWSFSLARDQKFSIEGEIVEQDDAPEEVKFGGLDGLQATTP